MENKSNNKNLFSAIFGSQSAQENAELRESSVIEEATEMFRENKTYRERNEQKYVFCLYGGFFMQGAIMLLSLAFVLELFIEHLPMALGMFRIMLASVMTCVILILIEGAKRMSWFTYFHSVILAKAKKNKARVQTEVLVFSIALLALSCTLAYQGAELWTRTNLDKSKEISLKSDSTRRNIHLNYGKQIEALNAQIEPLQAKQGQRAWGLTENENANLVYLQSEKKKLQEKLDKELSKIESVEVKKIATNTENVNEKGAYMIFVALLFEFGSVFCMWFCHTYLAKVYAENKKNSGLADASFSVTVDKYDPLSKMLELQFEYIKHLANTPTLPIPTNENKTEFHKIPNEEEKNNIGFRPPQKGDTNIASPTAKFGDEKSTHHTKEVTVTREVIRVMPKNEKLTNEELLTKHSDIVALFNEYDRLKMKPNKTEIIKKTKKHRDTVDKVQRVLDFIKASK